MKNTKSKPISFHLNKNQVSATVQLDEDMEGHFHTPQRVSLSAVIHTNETIELTLHFKTFNGVMELTSDFLLSEDNNHEHQLLHTLTKTNVIPLLVESNSSHFEQRYVASISLETRESIKTALGELRDYREVTNLKDAFKGFPQGFVVPYANRETFHLLVKLNEKLFQKIYLSDTESIRTATYVDEHSFVLSVLYADTTIGSIRFSKHQVCDNILEDFEILLSKNQVAFVLASDDLNREHYLHLTDNLRQEDVTRLTRFLFTKFPEQHFSS